MITLSWSPATAQSLETREQELEGLRLEIVRLTSDLQSVQQREDTLEGKLEVARAELALQQARVEEADREVELASAKVEKASRDAAALERDLDILQSDLKRRVVGLYRLGGKGFLRLFLSLEAGDDLLPSIRQLRFLVRRDQDTIARYVTVRDALEATREVLERQKAQVETWQEQELSRRDELRDIERRRSNLLERLGKERRRLAARTDALQDKERKLLSLMNRLEDGVQPVSGAPIQDFRGVLDWPARGDVQAEFGAKTDPRYQTEVPQHGIDLKVEPGTKIRAVYPGEVLYASEFEGYGPMVVVHHSGRVFTLYAGLDLMNVGPGDVLSLGDVVGVASDLMYFEIRVDNEPQNPRQWLR